MSEERQRQKIVVTISELDLQEVLHSVVYHNNNVTWNYTDQYGTAVDVEFINIEEEEQRGM
jgi:hypothetical protein